MIWYVIALILFACAMALMGLQYVRQRRYLRKKPGDAMSEQLWQEIQEEREASKERREKFQAALKQVQTGGQGSSELDED